MPQASTIRHSIRYSILAIRIPFILDKVDIRSPLFLTLGGSKKWCDILYTGCFYRLCRSSQRNGCHHANCFLARDFLTEILSRKFSPEAISASCALVKPHFFFCFLLCFTCSERNLFRVEQNFLTAVLSIMYPGKYVYFTR